MGRGHSVAGAPPLSDGCKPDSVRSAAFTGTWTAICLAPHLSDGAVLADCDYYPEVPRSFRSGFGQATRFLLFCLAPHGVFRAPGLASGAVGSYPAFSPFPSGFHRLEVCFL